MLDAARAPLCNLLCSCFQPGSSSPLRRRWGVTRPMPGQPPSAIVVVLPMAQDSGTRDDHRGLSARRRPLRVWLNPEHARHLLQLGYELCWATTWMDEANQWITPVLGLPELPFVDFGDALFHRTPRRGPLEDRPPGGLRRRPPLRLVVTSKARGLPCHTCSFGNPSVTRSEDRQPLASRDDMRRHFTTTASCSCASYY